MTPMGFISTPLYDASPSQHLEERDVTIAQDRIQLVDRGRDVVLDDVGNVNHVANVGFEDLPSQRCSVDSSFDRRGQ